MYKTGNKKPILDSCRVFCFHVTAPALEHTFPTESLGSVRAPRAGLGWRWAGPEGLEASSPDSLRDCPLLPQLPS